MLSPSQPIYVSITKDIIAFLTISCLNYCKDLWSHLPPSLSCLPSCLPNPNLHPKSSPQWQVGLCKIQTVTIPLECLTSLLLTQHVKLSATNLISTPTSQPHFPPLPIGIQHSMKMELPVVSPTHYLSHTSVSFLLLSSPIIAFHSFFPQLLSHFSENSSNGISLRNTSFSLQSILTMPSFSLLRF